MLTNIAIWESAEHLSRAFASPKFQQLLADPQGSASYRHLVHPVAVSGICAGAPWGYSFDPSTDRAAGAVSTIDFFELCPKLPFTSQLAATDGPFTLFDIVIAPRWGTDTAIAAWYETTQFMRQRAGLLRPDLYRGSAGSNVLVNLAVWESAAALLEAVRSPGLDAATCGYPLAVHARARRLLRSPLPESACPDTSRTNNDMPASTVGGAGWRSNRPPDSYTDSRIGRPATLGTSGSDRGDRRRTPMNVTVTTAAASIPIPLIVVQTCIAALKLSPKALTTRAPVVGSPPSRAAVPRPSAETASITCLCSAEFSPVAAKLPGSAEMV
ncbi:hypothetical protein [Nocardia asteroides]|uniref:hypothetical protein n=1 Tax=Nocardia asteroides TaxID=1824 RepID=UPI003405B253